MREVQSSCQQLYCICVLLLADEDDLRDVRSAVAVLSGRWQHLGVSLGIRLSDLEAFLSDNPHSSSDCLLKMLSLWLKQNYKVWTSGATLELLHVCEAAMSCESEWKGSPLNSALSHHQEVEGYTV